MPSRLMDREIKTEPPDFDYPELPVTPPPEFFRIPPFDVKQEPTETIVKSEPSENVISSENSNVSLLPGEPVARERMETESRGTARNSEADSSELPCTPPPSRSASNNDMSSYNLSATTAIIPEFRIKKEPDERSSFEALQVGKTTRSVISTANTDAVLLPADPALCRTPEYQGRREMNPCFNACVPLAQTPEPFMNDNNVRIKKEPGESSSLETLQVGQTTRSVISASDSIPCRTPESQGIKETNPHFNACVPLAQTPELFTHNNNDFSNCSAAAVALIPEHNIKKEKIETALFSMPAVREVAKSVASAENSNPLLLPADRALATERWIRNNPYSISNNSFNSVGIDTEIIAGCNGRKRPTETNELDVPGKKRNVNKSVTGGVENSNTEPFQSAKRASGYSNPPVGNVALYSHTREPRGSVLNRPGQHMPSLEPFHLNLNARNSHPRETVHACAASCEILPAAQAFESTEKSYRISSPSVTMLTHTIRQRSLRYNAAERHSREINAGLLRKQHFEETSERVRLAQAEQETISKILAYASSSRKDVLFQSLKTGVEPAVALELPTISEEVASAVQKSKMYFSSFRNEDHKSVYCDPPVIYVSFKNNTTPAMESEVKPKGIFNMIKILEDTISQCPVENYHSFDPICDAKPSNLTFLINDKSYRRALFSPCTSESRRNSVSPVPHSETSIPPISLSERSVSQQSGGNQGSICNFEEATKSPTSRFSCEGANYNLQNSSLLLTSETPESTTSPFSASVSSRPAMQAATFEASIEPENSMPVETPRNSVNVETCKSSHFLNETARLNFRNSSSGSISKPQGQPVSSVLISENNSSSSPVTATPLLEETGDSISVETRRNFSDVKIFNTTTSNFTAQTANFKLLQNFTNENLMTILDTARSATPRNMTGAHQNRLSPDRVPNAGYASQECIFKESSNSTGRQESDLTGLDGLCPIDLSTKKY